MRAETQLTFAVPGVMRPVSGKATRERFLDAINWPRVIALLLNAAVWAALIAFVRRH